MDGKTEIYIGTAGWSYKDWVGVFYPPELPQQDWLRFYADYFNCVEVNSTYYSLPGEQMVRGWVEKVSDAGDFTFIIKAFQNFTHKKITDRAELASFTASLDILSGHSRLAGVLVQFPYSFDCNQANMLYLGSLLDELSSYTRFVEFRHNSWQNERVAGTLSESGAHICSIDQPSVGRSFAFRLDVNSPKLYLRLHGRNAKAWTASVSNFGKRQSYEQQSERYNYLYSRGEILEIVVKVKEAISKLTELYIIANNHPHGNAVVNSFELLEFLKLKLKNGIPKTTKDLMRKLQRTAD